MTEKGYGMTTRPDLSHEEAVERTRVALQEEGFGEVYVTFGAN